MSTPVMVSVPLEALEAVRRLSKCWHSECLNFAVGFELANVGHRSGYAWFCDDHKSHQTTMSKDACHARALNRAIEWGQQMRAMRGKR